MAVIIRQLLDYSRTGRAQGASCRLLGVVRESVSLVETLARKSQVDVALNVDADTEARPLEIPMGAGYLQQVLLNIMINSVHASPTGATIDVSVSTRRETDPESRSEREVAQVRIRDSGEGMTPSTLDRIFEPFFTTKEVGAGTGLGLSVAYGIVREAGGYIHAESQPKRGTTLTVVVPLQ
jgi:signal transduction histidine kinase